MTKLRFVGMEAGFCEVCTLDVSVDAVSFEYLLISSMSLVWLIKCTRDADTTAESSEIRNLVICIFDIVSPA
jgi:hypothetical protein